MFWLGFVVGVVVVVVCIVGIYLFATSKDRIQPVNFEAEPKQPPVESSIEAALKTVEYHKDVAY